MPDWIKTAVLIAGLVLGTNGVQLGAVTAPARTEANEARQAEAQSVDSQRILAEQLTECNAALRECYMNCGGR